ncbi:MAG TPA: hypothetical protein PL182_05965 [Pseudobdellovibrionaceae bacterium]|nr:hypothetical protein [Pseudobdellovibrionaceae bacterium]
MMDVRREIAGHFGLLETRGATSVFEVFLPETLSYFEGHFPETPILPAVGLIDLTQFFISLILNEPDLILASVQSFRVRQPAFAGERFRVTLDIPESSESASVLWTKADGQNLAELIVRVSAR